MDDLIERLESAAKGSRELDADIWNALHGPGAVEWDDAEPYADYPGPASEPLRLVPRFTTSIDAALVLVPKGWDWLARTGRTGSSCFANVTRDFQSCSYYAGGEWRDESTGDSCPARAATPALAIAAAALKAWENEDG